MKRDNRIDAIEKLVRGMVDWRHINEKEVYMTAIRARCAEMVTECEELAAEIEAGEYDI